MWFVLYNFSKFTGIDFNVPRIELLKSRYPNISISSCPPKEFVESAVDILCPCATGIFRNLTSLTVVGGVISRDNIPLLKCKLILGTANNQV